MPRKVLLSLTISILTVIAAAPGARSQGKLPDLSGTYHCEAYPVKCDNSGQTFTVTQMGSKVTVKNEKGAVGAGDVTSNISVSLGPPWNTIGIISADARTIEWSAGTRWRKQ
jgi:hypothetical protein